MLVASDALTQVRLPQKGVRGAVMLIDSRALHKAWTIRLAVACSSLMAEAMPQA